MYVISRLNLIMKYSQNLSLVILLYTVTILELVCRLFSQLCRIPFAIYTVVAIIKNEQR